MSEGYILASTMSPPHCQITYSRSDTMDADQHFSALYSEPSGGASIRALPPLSSQPLYDQ